MNYTVIVEHENEVCKKKIKRERTRNTLEELSFSRKTSVSYKPESNYSTGPVEKVILTSRKPV